MKKNKNIDAQASARLNALATGSVVSSLLLLIVVFSTELPLAQVQDQNSLWNMWTQWFGSASSTAPSSSAASLPAASSVSNNPCADAGIPTCGIATQAVGQKCGNTILCCTDNRTRIINGPVSCAAPAVCSQLSLLCVPQGTAPSSITSSASSSFTPWNETTCLEQSEEDEVNCETTASDTRALCGVTAACYANYASDIAVCKAKRRGDDMNCRLTRCKSLNNCVSDADSANIACLADKFPGSPEWRDCFTAYDLAVAKCSLFQCSDADYLSCISAIQ